MLGIARGERVDLLGIRVSPMIMGKTPIEIGSPRGLLIGSKEFEKVFQIVNIREVADFLGNTKNITKATKEERIRRHVRYAEKMQMPNFRRPVLDPSFIGYRRSIIYCQGKDPAVGKTARWWGKAALDFMPEKNSRLSDEIREDVYLASLVKELVEEEGYKEKEAWRAVCINSSKIGNYCDSKNGGTDFEKTGRRRYGRYFDLGNTKKIIQVSEDSESYLLAGGSINCHGRFSSLATRRKISDPDNTCEDGIGVIITDV